MLSAESARAMREAQIAVPDRWLLGSHWGLGWILFDWGGRRLYGHDGNTLGQAAFLRVKLRHLDEWNARRTAVAERYVAVVFCLPAVLVKFLSID